jgi:2,3-bisphosphoglycerate-dependent phosphoglycerate mutase
MSEEPYSYLVLVRHGESEWNKEGLWTGWENPHLDDHGKEQAKTAANLIKDIHFDIAFTSRLVRVKETFNIIRSELHLEALPTEEASALNERHYGIYQGKNKWEVEKEVGEIEFEKIRRSWDYPIENGETLKDTYTRVMPYYQEYILPHIKADQNVLVVSSGNALRALVKHLEDLSEQQVVDLEFGIGEVYVYKLDREGNIISKEIRNSNPLKGQL